MRPLRTRSDLTALVAQHAPSKACARAISEGRAHVLGGFTPALGFHQLIVRVRSVHGREWIIAVEIDVDDRSKRVLYLDAIPWACWDGVSGGKRPLIDGDKPTLWAFEKMQARKKDHGRQSGVETE